MAVAVQFSSSQHSSTLQQRHPQQPLILNSCAPTYHGHLHHCVRERCMQRGQVQCGMTTVRVSIRQLGSASRSTLGSAWQNFCMAELIAHWYLSIKILLLLPLQTQVQTVLHVCRNTVGPRLLRTCNCQCFVPWIVTLIDHEVSLNVHAKLSSPLVKSVRLLLHQTA